MVFETYNQLPYIYARQPDVFADLLRGAHSRSLRIALLGDSQETNPGGNGRDYIPDLNYRFWQRYRNAPETPFTGHISFGTGSPPAEWLLRGTNASPGPSATRLANNQIPPGYNFSPKAHSTKNSGSNVNGQTYGQLTGLLHDGSLLSSGVVIPAGQYFRTDGAVRAEIFGATNASSGEIYYRARPRADSNPSYFSAITTQGPLALGLEDATFAVKSGLTDPLDFNGLAYMQLEVHGDSDAKLTDILGLRFRNVTYPHGVVVDDLAAGGYKTSDFLASHGDCGDWLAALAFDVFWLHYGANESSSNVTAETYKTNTEALIAQIRTWYGNDQLPFVLTADPSRNSLTAAQQTEFDQYQGALHAICEADAYCLSLNSRRKVADVDGWDTGSTASWLSDSVHYTSDGANVLSLREVQVLYSLPDLRRHRTVSHT